MAFTNIIALFKVIVLPFIVYFIYQNNIFFTFLAVLLLFILVLTDLVDRFATNRELLRSFFQPFSNKIIVFVLLFVFFLKGSFSGIILGIFVLRDVIVGVIRILASRDDVRIKGSSIYGKVITSSQYIIVFILLLTDFILGDGLKNYLILLDMLFVLFTIITFILAIISIFHYSSVYGKGLHERREFGKRVKHEKLVILANKKSGGYHDSYRRHLLKIFAKRRKAKIVYLNRRRKDMFADVEKKIKDARQVIIAGGDGSFESALNNNFLRNKPLGFFPLGAGNAFYSYFYKGKRFEYLRSRFKFKEVSLDVLELSWEKGKRLTSFIGIGADAEVAKIIKNKSNHNFADYFSASADVAFGTKVKYDLRCSVDDKDYHWNNCINLIVGKVPYLGYGIRSLIGSMHENDGKILGVACVNTHHPIYNKSLRLWALLLTQLGLAKSPLVSLNGEKFVVKSDKPFPIQAGGEFIGYSKCVKIRIKRKQKVLIV